MPATTVVFRLIKEGDGHVIAVQRRQESERKQRLMRAFLVLSKQLWLRMAAAAPCEQPGVGGTACVVVIVEHLVAKVGHANVTFGCLWLVGPVKARTGLCPALPRGACWP